jgi:hypothetical protein
MIFPLVRCPETRTWSRKFLGKTQLIINEDLVHRKIINCTNRTQLKNIGQYLNRVRGKRELKRGKIEN